jgi:hypothetical protein
VTLPRDYPLTALPAAPLHCTALHCTALHYSQCRVWAEVKGLSPGKQAPGHVLLRCGLLRRGLLRCGLLRRGLLRWGLLRWGLLRWGLLRRGLLRWDGGLGTEDWGLLRWDGGLGTEEGLAAGAVFDKRADNELTGKVLSQIRIQL